MSYEVRIDTDALNALLAPFDRTDAPGFAVGVAVKGVPVYRRGVGLASIELPVALSPTIRMRIGSTSKHFCVLALMLLVEEGKLTLEDSVRRHLPEFPEWAERMTVRQLMAHTSGMRDSLDLLLQSAELNRSAPADRQVKMLAKLDSLNFEPGAGWSYNNGGYVLLSEILERLSGVGIAAFLRARIFEPAGMFDTVLRPLDTDMLSNSASLHVPLPGGGYQRGIFGPPILGEGGIVSTVDDMLRWLKHMADPVVGSARAWAEMRTPVSTHGYGLGLFMDQYRGLATVHHAGGVVGGCSQMLKVIEPDVDIILMSNGPNAFELYRLENAILDACFTGLPARTEDISQPIVEGNFFSVATGRVISLAEDDGRQALALAGMSIPTLRDAAGEISVPLLSTDLTIRPVRADGEVGALEIVEYGCADRLERVVPGKDASIAGFIGRYDAAPAPVVATISLEAGVAPQLKMTGPLGSLDYRLVPIGPDLWQTASSGVLPSGGTLEFDGRGISFSNTRTRRLRFERVA